MVRTLTAPQAEARLNAVRAWALRLPAASGKLATIGFCWGGARSFAYAAATPPPDAAVVYYGTAPDSATLLRVHAPVMAFYGSDDARVNATIGPAKKLLGGRSYETHVFEGAGHGFLRAQTLRDGASLRASAQGWPRTVAFLRRYLE